MVIGFAAETNSATQNAKIKLKDKNLDAIVVNDVSRNDIGFESNQNEVTFISETKERTIAKTDKDSLSRADRYHLYRIQGAPRKRQSADW